MKKLLTLFAVFALTAPVLAADPNVLVTCDETGLVSYEVLVEDGVDPGLMRGIALDITTSNSALITGISQYDAEGAGVPADSESIPAGYSIYMGSVTFATDPNLIADFGDPVAPNTDPDALGGLGTTGITVEMGSLYADGDPAPPTSGPLFKLDIDLNGESDTVLTIVANATRGGCVMEDGTSANVVAPGCTVGPSDCMAQTNPAYNDWVSLGKPACWCYQKQGHGDIDGVNFGPFAVAANDFTALKAAINKPVLPAGGECADLNHTKFGPFRVAADDFAELKRWINKPAAGVPNISGPGCVGFQGSAAAPGPCDANPLPNSEYVFWTN